MSTPEPRFEVPPEYAEVYEQAYRRAYEEVQASLTGGAAPVSGIDGRASADIGGVDSPDEPVSRTEAGVTSLARAPASRSGSGRRADRSRRRGRGPLVLVAGALLVVLAVAFGVGRLTAGGPSPTGRSVGQRTVGPVYPGPTRPATVRDVSATCSALASKGSGGASVDYDARNVLDDDPATAWRCDRLAVGQELDFTLAPGSRVVQVGLVPGYARGASGGGKDDTYARDNRITRVQWLLGNGTVVQQSMSDDPRNRALRTTIVPPTTTGEVRLKIVRVSQGERNSTAISTVQILTSA